jgi:hypothetical protein
MEKGRVPDCRSEDLAASHVSKTEAVKKPRIKILTRCGIEKLGV